VGQVSSERLASVITLQAMTAYVVAIDLPLSPLAAGRHSSAGLVSHLAAALSDHARGDVECAEVGSMTRRGTRLVRVRVEATVRAHDAGEALAAAIAVLREAVAAHERDWDITMASATVTPT
jgi:hypothetical protein